MDVNNDIGEYQFQEPTLEIKQYLGLLLNWLWLILIVTILGGGISYMVSTRLPKVYEASTKVLVMEAASAKTTDYNSILSSERLAKTYSDLMTTDVILNEVISRLHLPMTYTDLAEQVSVSSVTNTQLILISVKGNNPQQITAIANTIVAVFIEKIGQIQTSRYTETKQNLQTQVQEMEAKIQEATTQKAAAKTAAEKERIDNQIVQYQQLYTTLTTSYEQARLAEAQDTANVVQVNTAQIPAQPVSPKVALNTVLGLIAGAILAVAGVFLFDALDDTIKTPEDVTRVTGLPVMGTIYQHNLGNELITVSEPRSPISEAFRSLRTNIQYSNVDNPIRTLLVTSPSPSEGKTQISTNLAVVFAQGDRKVTLIDADLRRPTVHRRMKVSNIYGLSHLFMQTNIQLSGVVQKTRIDRLSVISAGDLPPNPAELLGSMKMTTILDKVRELSDIVILDAPPILPVADATILTKHADGVLLVIRPGQTKIAAARQSVETLRRLNAHLIGVVINGINQKSSRYSYYYKNSDYYNYESDTVSEGKRVSKRDSTRPVKVKRPE